MYDIILTNNFLTTVASIIIISYFTKDMIKYLINLIRTYVTQLKNKLINQMKNLIIETMNDKLNNENNMNDRLNNENNMNDRLNNENNINNKLNNENKINDLFEDISKTKNNIDESLYEINKRGSSIHSQKYSASMYPSNFDNVTYIGTTGEYMNTPMNSHINTHMNNENNITHQDNLSYMQNDVFNINCVLDDIYMQNINQKSFEIPQLSNNNQEMFSTIPVYESKPSHVHFSKLTNKMGGLLKRNNKNDDLFYEINNQIPSINSTNKVPIYDVRGEIKHN